MHLFTLVKPSPNYADEFGAALALGDITDDGVLDIAVGARGATVNGKISAGEVYLFSLPK